MKESRSTEIYIKTKLIKEEDYNFILDANKDKCISREKKQVNVKVKNIQCPLKILEISSY
jgi:hypothetical protein